MADRTAASLFSFIFKALADGTPKDVLAKRLWEKSCEYDFSDYQMYCDDALIALGLARKQEDGEVIYLRDPR